MPEIAVIPRRITCLMHFHPGHPSYQAETENPVYLSVTYCQTKRPFIDAVEQWDLRAMGVAVVPGFTACGQAILWEV